MKPSEMIKPLRLPEAREIQRDEILDEMAEDIKAMKYFIMRLDSFSIDVVRSPFEEREWEK
jgi:hypothetical protein